MELYLFLYDKTSIHSLVFIISIFDYFSHDKEVDQSTISTLSIQLKPHIHDGT